jgi:hypothetical protein
MLPSPLAETPMNESAFWWALYGNAGVLECGEDRRCGILVSQVRDASEKRI